MTYLNNYNYVNKEEETAKAAGSDKDQDKEEEAAKEEEKVKKTERVHNYKYHYDERPVGVTSSPNDALTSAAVADESGGQREVEARLETASSSSEYSDASETTGAT